MQNRIIKTIILLCVICLLSLIAGSLYSQNTGGSETVQRGSIPDELLRPHRSEAPHYPVDTVIGALGQGTSAREAYDLARRAAIAFLAGTADAPVFSAANRAFIRDCIGQVQTIEPRQFRLGGGREEPDGSASFMIRFIGREYSITGEMFIRLHEREAAPVSVPAPAAESPEPDENEELPETEEPAGPLTAEEALAPTVPEQVVQAPLVPVIRTWTFDDMILEDPRSLSDENRETRQHFDFPPYERFF
ncbi:MAG: hypothetical protein FWG89_10850 [Treponema sp.]|nr:hypothetical protein [Treponema sp.]